MVYVKNKKIATFIITVAVIVSMIWMLRINAFAGSVEDTKVNENVQWPVAVSAENFPDDVFRQYVSDKIDTDGNNEIFKTEAEAVTKIRIVNNRDVKSLKGIELFPELENLYCDGDSVTELDVSQNTKLKVLNCSNNKISNLDLSKNVMLENLECFTNGIETLDLSGNPELKNLLCGGDKMKGIDISKNRKLESFGYLAGGVKEIDFSNNPELRQIWVSGTPLEHLDVSHNPKLESLLVYITNIQTLDLTNNPLLTANNVNLHSDRLISLHTVMPDADQMNIQNQRAVTVQVPAGNSDYDLRQLDPKIEPEAIQRTGDVVIENAIVRDVHPGMEISYHYTENGIDLLSKIRFIEKDQETEPENPVTPEDPVTPDKPADPNDDMVSNGVADHEINSGHSTSTGQTGESISTEKAEQKKEYVVNTGDERKSGVVIASIMILSAAGLMLFTNRKKENK